MKIAPNYYRIMLGRKSIHAKECYKEAFIGCDWSMDFDLSGKLPENWRDFNKAFVPVFLKHNPEKSKVAAGLACSMLYTICKGINIGDIVICPTGSNTYYVGEVSEGYSYVSDGNLPHRRKVQWFPKTIDRSEMSQALQNSTGSLGTVSDISKHGKEIQNLLDGNALPQLISTDESVEDPTVFALEKHLEDFLVDNWESTELGKKYDIVKDGDEIIGQQYPSDVGPIDILAISKDEKEYLVVELKKGRASDTAVGQIQRYMGYVQEELSESGQTVRGAIIALKDDLRLKYALRVTKDIEFYKYEVSFKLLKD